MRGVEEMTAALEVDFWVGMRVLADAHEERGGHDDMLMAAGYRWMARLRKFPAGDRDRWFWMPPRTVGWAVDQSLPPDMEGSASARVPDFVRNETAKMANEIGCNFAEFRSLSKCLAAGALAVGRWLWFKDQGE